MKMGMRNWKKVQDDKKNGLWTRWHENGQKLSEVNYKDDEEVDWVLSKHWNSKGEPVDSLEETE